MNRPVCRSVLIVTSSSERGPERRASLLAALPTCMAEPEATNAPLGGRRVRSAPAGDHLSRSAAPAARPNATWSANWTQTGSRRVIGRRRPTNTT